MTRLRSLVGLWAACCALLVACDGAEVVTAPTQIMLEIESDDALRASLSELHVAVALRRAGVFDERRSVVLPAARLQWPVQIPVTPRSAADASESFEVLVQARGAGGVLAETRAFASFLKKAHRTLKLRLFSCPGHPAGFTCAEEACRGPECKVCTPDGSCVPAGTIDPNQLPPTPGPDDDAGQPGGVEAGVLQDAATGQEAGVKPDAAGSDAGTTPLDASAEAGLDASADAATDASSGDAAVGNDASVDAGSDASTTCQSGTKRCGTACIPEAQCCADADCSGGMLCRQGSCKRWCEGQMRPADVLAADYQCIDADLGLPSVSTWVPSTSSNNLIASNDRSYSAPNSLRCMNLAYTSWTTQAANAPQSIELSAMINPTPPPSGLNVSFISLVCFDSGVLDDGPAFRHCLMYSNKRDIDNAPGYAGLWIETSAGTGTVRDHALYDPAAPSTALNFNWNAWNTLSMKVDGNQMQVTVNGKTASFNSSPGPNGKVTILLGSGEWAVNYDNVVVSIRR